MFYPIDPLVIIHAQEVVRCIAVERLNPWELERFYPSFDEVYFHTAKEELQEQVQKTAFSPSEPVEEEEEIGVIEARKKRGRPKKGEEVEEPPRGGEEEEKTSSIKSSSITC